MVYTRRVHSNIFKKKPRVILDERFSFARTLGLGEKGQLDVVIRVKDIGKVYDEDFNEFRESHSAHSLPECVSHRH